MAKGLGLLGNFNGKVGNTVGYAHKTSKDKQTQGIRLHQPIVKNPKTYGQAEQRMKVAPINATYRALRSIIKHSFESSSHGNRNRLEWFRMAMNKFNGPYYQKGAIINAPTLLQISKGSLDINLFTATNWQHVWLSTAIHTLQVGDTLGKVSTNILIKNPELQAGDILTFVSVCLTNSGMFPIVDSFVLDPNSTKIFSNHFGFAGFSIYQDTKNYSVAAGTIIIRRQNLQGKYLYNNAILQPGAHYQTIYLTEDAKLTAIQSYMSADVNSDWPEEEITE